MKPKILIIRFSSIGDIVLTTPIVRCISEQMEAEVHYLTKASFHGIVRHNPYIDKVYTIQKEVTEVIKELKSEQYDYVIDLHKNLRTMRVKFALGVKTLSFSKLNIEKWLKVNLKVNRLPELHIVDRYFDGISILKVNNDGRGLDYFVAGHEQEEADHLIHSFPEFAVLVLGANYYTKRIPEQLSSRIIAKSDTPIVLLGGGDVKEEAAILASKFPKKTINYVGKTSLAVSAGIVKRAAIVHTADTGLMHVAAAYKRKIVTYWGSTIPELGMYAYLPSGAPRSDNKQVLGLNCRPCSKLGFNSCPKGHFRCMLDQKI